MTGGEKQNERGGRRVLVGHISEANGLRGEVLVKSYTSVPADIAAYGPLQDESGKLKFEIAILRETKRGLIARIKGVSDRTEAEALRGAKLYLLREHLPEADEEEYYYADLIGLSAVLADGTAHGTIVAVQNFGAGDLLEIAPAAGGPTVLLPFTKSCVPGIDVAGGRVTVSPPIDLEDQEDK